jgi:hypothetical protein
MAGNNEEDHRQQAINWLEHAQDVANDDHLRSIRNVLIALTHATLAANQPKLPPQQIGWWSRGELYAINTQLDRLYQPVPVYVHPDEIPQRAISPPDPNLGDVHY